MRAKPARPRGAITQPGEGAVLGEAASDTQAPGSGGNAHVWDRSLRRAGRRRGCVRDPYGGQGPRGCRPRRRMKRRPGAGVLEGSSPGTGVGCVARPRGPRGPGSEAGTLQVCRVRESPPHRAQRERLGRAPGIPAGTRGRRWVCFLPASTHGPPCAHTHAYSLKQSSTLGSTLCPFLGSPAGINSEAFPVTSLPRRGSGGSPAQDGHVVPAAGGSQRLRGGRGAPQHGALGRAPAAARAPSPGR